MVFNTLVPISNGEILDIECAGGSQLPYSGYIEVNINTPGSTNNFNTYLVLVVPDSNYNQHIPLLIGTNVLNTILQDLHQLRPLFLKLNWCNLGSTSRSIGSNAKSDA
jgi:hypothetical protein